MILLPIQGLLFLSNMVKAKKKCLRKFGKITLYMGKMNNCGMSTLIAFICSHLNFENLTKTV